MESNNENRTNAQRPAYEAPTMEVALVAGPGVRTDDYVYSKDTADNDLSFDSLLG